MASELPRLLDTTSKLALFSVSGLKDEKLIKKKQIYIENETCKLYSRVFWIFLPNLIKIDPYNFELYRFKVGAFFETQSSVKSNSRVTAQALYNHRGQEMLNKWVLSRDQKTSTEGAEVTRSGRLFQTRACSGDRESSVTDGKESGAADNQWWRWTDWNGAADEPRHLPPDKARQ